jgi:hypothetical protein
VKRISQIPQGPIIFPHGFKEEYFGNHPLQFPDSGYFPFLLPPVDVFHITAAIRRPLTFMSNWINLPSNMDWITEIVVDAFNTG